MKIRFKINDAGEGVVVTVDRILTRTEEKVAGIRSMIFRCRNTIMGFGRYLNLSTRFIGLSGFV
jgi:hypothetical protein